MLRNNRIFPLNKSTIPQNSSEINQQKILQSRQDNIIIVENEQKNNIKSYLEQTINNSKLSNYRPSQKITPYVEVQMSQLFVNRFNIFCKANLICYSKRIYQPLLCFILILIPTIITIFYPIRVDVQNGKFSTLFIFIAVIILCFFNYLRLLFINPGILPSKIKDRIDEICIPQKIFPDKETLITTGKFFENIKYCETCQIYRPPRSSHCPICDCCFELLDHHCPWLNICIAKRNYSTFFFFILWLNVALVISIVLNCILIFGQQDIGQSIIQNIPSFIAIIYLFVASLFTVNLFLFHIYLVFTNQTTKEHIKYGSQQTIYLRKSWQNIFMLGCQSKAVLFKFKDILQIELKKNQDSSQSQIANLNFPRNQSLYDQEDSIVSQSKIDKFNEANSSFKSVRNSQISKNSQTNKNQPEEQQKQANSIHSVVYSKFLERADQNLKQIMNQTENSNITHNTQQIKDAKESNQNTQYEKSAYFGSTDQKSKFINLSLAKQKSDVQLKSLSMIKDTDKYEAHVTSYTHRNHQNISIPLINDEFSCKAKQDKTMDVKSIFNTSVNHQFEDFIEEDKKSVGQVDSSII
ncbi:hypothetical protein ABPG74_010396 [Tetrahymena malaccensis]